MDLRRTAIGPLRFIPSSRGASVASLEGCTATELLLGPSPFEGHAFAHKSGLPDL